MSRFRRRALRLRHPPGAAPDHKRLLKARAALLEEMRRTYKKEMDAFGSICGSHQDDM